MVRHNNNNGARGSKMFNFNKWVKSWFSSDEGVKTAGNEFELQKSRESQGTTSEDHPMIAEKTFDRKERKVNESIVEDNIKRKDDSSGQSLEAQMDSKLTYSVRKEDGIRDEVTRTSVATEKYDQEYRDAYASAEKKLNKQTDLFEKYIGKTSSKKVPSNVESSASGLPNNPERFVNFNGVPDIDAKKNLSKTESHSSVKAMHTTADLSSLKVLDAKVFNIAIKAASLGREFTEEENEIINSVIQDKREIFSK